jgi:hypothetical protein
MDDTKTPNVILTKEEWLARCAAHFKKRAALDDETSMELAIQEWDIQEENGWDDDFRVDPEECADSEMSYWDEC